MLFYNIYNENHHYFSDPFYRNDQQCEISYYDRIKIEEIMVNTGREYFNEFNILSVCDSFTKSYFGCATTEGWESGELVLIDIDESPCIYSVINNVYDEGELSIGSIKWIKDESDLNEYFKAMGISKERYRSCINQVNWNGTEKVLAYCVHYIVHNLLTLNIVGFGGKNRCEACVENWEYEQELRHIFEVNMSKDQHILKRLYESGRLNENNA